MYTASYFHTSGLNPGLGLKTTPIPHPLALPKTLDAKHIVVANDHVHRRAGDREIVNGR